MSDELSIIRKTDDPDVDVSVSMGYTEGVGPLVIFRGDPEKVVTLIEDMNDQAVSRIVGGEYKDQREGGTT